MTGILRLGGGLLLLVASNIAIGSIQAAVMREWDKRTFLRGLIKGGIVIGACVAVWFAGRLNPDLVVIEAGGQKLNLSTAFYLILVTGFGCYAGKILMKLKEIMTMKSSSGAGTEDAENSPPTGEEEMSDKSDERTAP